MKNEEVKKNTKKTSTKGNSGTKKTSSTKTTTTKKSNAVTKSKSTTTVKAAANSKKVIEKASNEPVNVSPVKNESKENDTKQNKNTNEITKMIIVIAVLVVLIVATFIIGITYNGSKFMYQKHVGIKDVSVNEYLDIIDDDDISIVYIARPTCSFCQMFEPVLTSVLEKYKIGVEYVNIDNITTEAEWNSFYNSNEYLKAGEWGTPTLIVFKNKEILNVNSGYVDEATLVKFLQDNELIKGE